MTNHSKAGLVWRLRKGMDRRFRMGHPWVYSNELSGSPKGIEPGALIELQDAAGNFMARGYGNPQSLIAFRALSRDPRIENPFDLQNLIRSLEYAVQLRDLMGLAHVSYRLCYGESDGIPGLVIDRYLTRKGQVFVAQAHTAGANRIIPLLSEILESIVKKRGNSPSWEQTAIVIRNDLGVRKLEGLEEENPRLMKEVAGMPLGEIEIAIQSVQGAAPIWFHVDLMEGQKTGFFLDQSSNIQLAAQRFQHLMGPEAKTIRILDLCCYVGQWSTQLAAVFVKQGKKVEVVAVDASASTLELAKKNIESEGATCRIMRANVLKDLGSLEDQSFDLIISDPPALIKNRKDIPAGTHAYMQLATQVFRLIRDAGAVVCCSCSALIPEEDFIQAQLKGSARNQVRVQWIGRGGQAPDHPVLAEFPEGRYLKAWLGVVRRS